MCGGGGVSVCVGERKGVVWGSRHSEATNSNNAGTKATRTTDLLLQTLRERSLTSKLCIRKKPLRINKQTETKDIIEAQMMILQIYFISIILTCIYIYTYLYFINHYWK